MDGFKKMFRMASKGSHFGSNYSAESGGGGGGGGVSTLSSEETGVLVTRTPGWSLSLSTSLKLCTVSFIIGVFVGYTLKRRFKRWASKLLKKLKDD